MHRLPTFSILFILLAISKQASAQSCNSTSINLLQSSRDFGYGIPEIMDPPNYVAPSPYAFTNVVPPNPGEYTIANNTTSWGGLAANWIDIEDNSITPIGYMMVVNSNPTADFFFSETLPLCEAGDYIFSFDAINLYDSNLPNQPLPNFDFYVDGALVTNFGLLPADGQWHNFNITFTVNTVADIPFELFNNTPGGMGNVFAVDNITLIRCGPELSLTELNPKLHCPGDSIEMVVTLGPNNYPDPWFQWQLSTDAGQNWGNYGNPTNQPGYTIYDLPIAAWIRLAAAPTQAELNNVLCVTYSGPFPVAFLPPEQCSDVITTIGDLCTGNQGANGFPNGDFGSGPDNVLPFDPGLAPSYVYEFNPPPDDGTYTITNNTTNWGSFAAFSWINIYDNSPDTNGYMMVVNASPEPGLFYEQTIPVCENTLYEFSCDVISLNWPIFIGTLAEPNISFLIDGVEVFASGNVPIDSTWRTFGFSITTAPGVNQLTLGLRNNTPGGQNNIGNDLAIDNISFRACGPDIQLSEISGAPYCTGDEATVQAGIGPGFSSPELQWQISTDNGLNWQDYIGPTNQATINIPNLQENILVRVLVAETTGNLLEENCRLHSDTISIEVFPNQQTIINDTICQGQVYIFGNQLLFETGNYEQQLMTQDGCDSLVVLNLEVEQLGDSTAVSICQGQSYVFGGQILTTAGVYQDTFQTADGCDSLVTLTLTIAPITNAVSASICQGQSYTFGSQILTTSGTYQEVFQTPGGCDSTVTLNLDVFQITNTISAAICEGQSYAFGSQTLTNSGTYQETFQTPDGCDSLVTLDLDVFLITNTVSAAICQGQSYTFGMQTLTNAGTYQETFQTPDGCDSLVMLILSVETFSGFYITGDSLLCTDGTGILSASNSYDTYAWSTGATETSINISTTGWYALTVTTTSGCTATDSIFVQPTAFSATISVDGPSCFGDSDGIIEITNIQGTPPFQFSLNSAPPQNNPLFTGLSDGQYALLIEDGSGCSLDTMLLIQAPTQLTITLSPDQTIDLGDTIPLSAITNYPVQNWQWTPSSGLSCADCPFPLASPAATTTFLVVATDTTGCTAEAGLTVTVNTEQRVYVPNVFSPNQDGANDFFTVFTGKGVALIRRFEVFDRWGNHVFSAPENTEPNSLLLQWDGTFRGKALDPAVFAWYTEVEFADGSTRVYSGDVTLMR